MGVRVAVVSLLVVVVVFALAAARQYRELESAKDDIEVLEAEVSSASEERDTLSDLVVVLLRRLNEQGQQMNSVETDVAALAADVGQHGNCLEELVDLLGVRTLTSYGYSAPIAGGC